ARQLRGDPAADGRGLARRLRAAGARAESQAGVPPVDEAPGDNSAAVHPVAGQLPGARAHGAAPGGLRGGLEAPRGPAVRALRSGGLWGRAERCGVRARASAALGRRGAVAGRRRGGAAHLAAAAH
ncbi:unnamed protein product, partial [Effrenium voratum]